VTRRLLAAAVVPALAAGALVLARHGDAAVSQAMPPPQAPTGVGNVTGLTPSLRRAVARAIDAARADGVALRVTSGWRSAEHQQRLYEDAIGKYGSPAVARQWVLPPEESAHVRGEAVDVGPPAGAVWLETYGVRFGLCRRYANEPWHFERLAPAVGSACPAMEAHA
jgi:D-alanyl-D-alanine carboxypeptidase